MRTSPTIIKAGERVEVGKGARRSKGNNKKINKALTQLKHF